MIKEIEALKAWIMLCNLKSDRLVNELSNNTVFRIKLEQELCAKKILYLCRTGRAYDQ